MLKYQTRDFGLTLRPNVLQHKSVNRVSDKNSVSQVFVYFIAINNKLCTGDHIFNVTGIVRRKT